MLTHHPAAAGAWFRLLLLALRYARHMEVREHVPIHNRLNVLQTRISTQLIPTLVTCIHWNDFQLVGLPDCIFWLHSLALTVAWGNVLICSQRLLDSASVVPITITMFSQCACNDST